MSNLLPLLNFLGRKEQTKNMSETMRDATHATHGSRRRMDGSAPPRLRVSRSMDGTLKTHRPIPRSDRSQHSHKSSSDASKRSSRFKGGRSSKPRAATPVVSIRRLGTGEIKTSSSRAA